MTLSPAYLGQEVMLAETLNSDLVLVFKGRFMKDKVLRSFKTN